VANQAIQGDDRLRVSVLFISGPYENWYMLLHENQRDTYEHLRAAFLARYTGQLNNRAVVDEIKLLASLTLITQHTLIHAHSNQTAASRRGPKLEHQPVFIAYCQTVRPSPNNT
jgi:hypothetical protein